MNKQIASLVLTLLISTNLQAEEVKDAQLSFWDQLRMRIEQIVPQKKVSATTAVGGVRGAKMATDDVYWKGEKTAETLDADELDAFKAAMKLAASGELEKAQLAFAEFVSKNPESPLRKDAEQALALLQPAK